MLIGISKKALVKSIVINNAENAKDKKPAKI